MGKGKSISNAIIIKTQDYISGMVEVHNRIDNIRNDLDAEIKSIDQNLIIENGKKYDVFTLRMESGCEKKFCFDITSLFIS
jgi:hypothetical protein